MKYIYYMLSIIIVQNYFFSMHQFVTTEIEEKKFNFLDKLDGYGDKEIQMNIKNSLVYNQICVTTQKNKAEICCFIYNYGIIKRLKKIFKYHSIEYSAINRRFHYFSIYTSLETTSCKSILDLLFAQESEITNDAKEGFITKVAQFITEQKLNMHKYIRS